MMRSARSQKPDRRERPRTATTRSRNDCGFPTTPDFEIGKRENRGREKCLIHGLGTKFHESKIQIPRIGVTAKSLKASLFL